jgi:hypothetical protein
MSRARAGAGLALAPQAAGHHDFAIAGPARASPSPPPPALDDAQQMHRAAATAYLVSIEAKIIQRPLQFQLRGSTATASAARVHTLLHASCCWALYWAGCVLGLGDNWEGEVWVRTKPQVLTK